MLAALETVAIVNPAGQTIRSGFVEALVCEPQGHSAGQGAVESDQPNSLLSVSPRGLRARCRFSRPKDLMHIST